MERKIAANASMDRSRDEDGLRRLAQRWLAEAAAADAADDGQLGDARGGEVPPAARNPQRIQALLDDIAAERAQRAEQDKAELVETATRRLASAQATLARMRAAQAAKTHAWQQRLAQATAAGRKPRGCHPKRRAAARTAPGVDVRRWALPGWPGRCCTARSRSPVWMPSPGLDSRCLAMACC
jgi:hypothetical protein